MANVVAHIMDIMPTGSLSDIKNSFKTTTWTYVSLLCYAVAGICGLAGGIRVYNLWNINGRHHVHIDAQVVAWMGAAIFLVIAMGFINMAFK